MSLDLRALVAQVVEERLPILTIPATVKTVDKAAATCDVQPVEADTPEMFDVRLRAVDDGSAAGFIAWPVVGSVVLVSLIDNDLNTAFVAAASQVESFTLSTSEESLATWLEDLGSFLQQLVLLTNAGATTGLAPTSAQGLKTLFDRLPKLLTK
jgi:hypothetical protein